MQLDAAGIDRIVTGYDRDAKALREELLRLCWYMRGGISYTEAHMLTMEERGIVGKIIEGNLETTKETQLPFF